MDSGAHFHRCDLQVHSPRDLNWVGARPATDDDRRRYATAFVQACRDKGLDAVAITDHHDLVFFQYIKDAAAGNPIVFPGMELTLAVPCQALLILDADFPVSLLSQVPTALGLAQPDPAAQTHAQTLPIRDTPAIKQVIAMLDRHDFLKGRYILIPNVTENGHKTLLRAGFAEQYKSAPCVAGYLDGAVPPERARGWHAIVEGRDANYGTRRIGVFQTSDSRHADFSHLGEHSTWVKWAEPTAEALRQACLASETRISQVAPELPRIVVRRLAVSNCKFLGPFDVDFNPQYNALIGGRGTGKSTVLEYLRWGLCDQPPDVAGEGDLPNFQSRRDQLIRKTLVPHQGIVTVEFEINGVAHAVRRRSDPHDLRLKLGDGEFSPCSEQDIRELLPIQAYSQKQLSVVGVQTEELLRLVQSPIESNLLELTRQESDIKKSIRAAVEARYTFSQTHREIRRLETELGSSRAQLQRLREALKGVSPQDQAVLDANDRFESEAQRVANVERQLKAMRDAADRAVRDFSPGVRTDLGAPVQGQAAGQPDTIAAIESQFATVRQQALQSASAIAAALAGGEAVTAVTAAIVAWRRHFDDHKAAYEQAKARASSQSAALQSINELEERTRQLQERYADRQRSLDELGNPESTYRDHVASWLALCDRRADLLAQECHRLTALSDGRIRATISKGTDTTAILERLSALTSGTRIRRDKLEALGEHVAAANSPLAEWCSLAEELYSLLPAPGQQLGETELPATPKMNGLGFNAQELTRVSAKMSLADWVGVLLAGIGDTPKFEYRQSEGDFIDFANASAGQQATALLKVLLNQNGPPLIIDQPEDDLDNEVVLEIVAAVWKAKSKRQVIISSHNANVVVNGDADLVVVFGYRQAGDHSLGRITEAGAIDVQRIRNAITSIMEGGERAFKLRQVKYGF